MIHGQILIARKSVAGKPGRVRVETTHPEDEWLIKLSGEGKTFFLNKAVIGKFYTEGKQLDLFPAPKTLIDNWKRKHLKL